MTGLVLQGALVLGGAPLYSGITRRLKARLQYRRGPSIWQPYRDLAKWWSKAAVESDASSPLTAAVPVLALAATAAAVLLVPIVALDATIPGAGDLLVVVGLLALVRFLLVLLSFDAGSAFGGMGGSREIAISALVEPGLVLALGVVALGAGSTDLSVIAARGLALGPASLSVPTLLAAAAFAIVAVAETGHEPVDNPDTHLELTMIHEGMILEASGRRLALLTYSSHLKFAVVAGIFFAAFLPFGAAGPDPSPAALLLGVAAAALKLGLATVALGLLDAGLAKLRILVLPSLLGLAAALGVTAVAAALWLPR
jgi:formate hydrogenlyase subunit 4